MIEQHGSDGNICSGFETFFMRKTTQDNFIDIKYKIDLTFTILEESCN